MQRLIVLFAMLLVVSLISAEELLKFDSTEHDFGDIEEVNGKVEHTFSFTNVSSKPIEINAVKAG
jgi:hypothetical protein